jgi:hypothetical protein
MTIVRPVSIPIFVVVGLLLAVPFARAECFVLTARAVMEPGDTELVFSGEVVEINRNSTEDFWATFDVDRVWKGEVPKRIDLYVWLLYPEVPRFEVGRHYVALARRLTDARARQAAGINGADTVVFSPVSCSAYLVPDIIRELGVGAAPK